MNSTVSAITTQVHRVYIKATPQQVWEAITTPEWADRYGYGGIPDFDLTPGAKYTVAPGTGMRASAAEGGFELPEVILDGEVLEVDPPRRLVLTWRMLMDATTAEEGFSKLSYEIEEIDGNTKLTLVHELTDAPMTANIVDGGMESQGAGGGWAWVLSDLKSLLETGTPLGR